MAANENIENNVNTENNGGSGNSEKKKLSRSHLIAIVIIVVFIAAVGTVAGFAAVYPEQAAQIVRQLVGRPSTPAVEQPSSSEAEEEGEEEPTEEPVEEYNGDAVPTRQIAAYGDIPIYSPIPLNNLTGVLFHQASFETALVLTTQLPEANVETVNVDNPVRVNHDQTEGEWLDADALHLYRMTDTTQMDTSIDVGAPLGTPVYAPVTGTVVLVQDYLLYGYVPDVQIHIQPEGHPELDLVLLHQYDPLVAPGDKVEGGVTRLSYVRDIAVDLTDVQLGFYTAADDPGNHSHVQLNNADYPGYRETSLKDAYVVK